MARNEVLFRAVCDGKDERVQELVSASVERGDDALELLADSMVPAMREVGDRFARNEVYIPEMLLSARAMQAALNVLEPMLIKTDYEPLAKIAIGAVKGDLHDIGKNLVAMMLRSVGFAIEDLGIDCDVEKFAQAVENGARAVCLSALLSTTVPYMRTVCEYFADDPEVKVIVGGAIVTQAYADEIGADGFGCNAGEAPKVVARALGIQL